MTWLAFRLELRRSRLVAFWMAVIVLAYGGIIAAMYPILEENATALEDYMEIFPKELMAAFGMTGSLVDPGVFFGTYIGSMLWPIVAAIAAIILATRPIASDVERGWADVALSTPLTRGRLLAAAIASQALVLALLAAATVAGVLVSAGSSAPTSTSRVSRPPRSSCGCSGAPSPGSPPSSRPSRSAGRSPAGSRRGS